MDTRKTDGRSIGHFLDICTGIVGVVVLGTDTGATTDCCAGDDDDAASAERRPAIPMAGAPLTPTKKELGAEAAAAAAPATLATGGCDVGFIRSN